ncbi:MAG: deoxynucleoside kinase [Candidatus Uhrbacteria bacterium]
MSYFIAVAGNMGVGKSELTARLGKRLGWKTFLEPARDNPYLSDYYADMPRWCFHSQIFFLAHRIEEHHALVAADAPAIQDRSVYENAEIFARIMYERGYLSQRDWNTYEALYHVLIQHLPTPTLVIYLQASVPTLVERIKQRGNAYEQHIDTAYLEELNHHYETWATTTTIAPVMRVETDTRNFVADEQELERLTSDILKLLPMQQLPLAAEQEATHVYP